MATGPPTQMVAKKHDGVAEVVVSSRGQQAIGEGQWGQMSLGAMGGVVGLTELNGSDNTVWPAELLHNTSKINEKCLPFHCS